MVLAIISAILLVLSFPNSHLSFLAFIGFLPLFFAIKNRSPRGAFLVSYVCGFLFYLGVLYWLYHVTTFGLVILCLYLALYFGIFGFLFNKIAFSLPCPERSRGKPSAVSLFLIPLIWTFLEWVQARLFSGFGWALLGYSQYKNLPLIQIADFSGVYGVSFVIMMINVVLWKSLKAFSVERIAYRKDTIRYPLSAIRYIVLILILVYSYGFFRLNQEEASREAIKVSVIQGNIPQNAKWDPAATRFIMDRFTGLSRAAALDNPSLIVWPETSFPGFFASDRELTKEVLDLAREVGIPLLIGANTENGIEIFNSAVLISENGEAVDKYDKIHLVPFGEYVPFSDRLPFLHRLVLGGLGEFTPGKEYKVFSLPCPERSRGKPSAFSRNIKFGALICFEDIFPEIARKFVKNGAEFLIVVTNDAWYGKSSAPYQHASCSVFRAIENRVPVVRSANTGYSCFIDSRGRIFDAVEENDTHLFITGYKTSIITFR